MNTEDFSFRRPSLWIQALTIGFSCFRKIKENIAQIFEDVSTIEDRKEDISMAVRF